MACLHGIAHPRSNFEFATIGAMRSPPYASIAFAAFACSSVASSTTGLPSGKAFVDRCRSRDERYRAEDGKLRRVSFPPDSDFARSVPRKMLDVDNVPVLHVVNRCRWMRIPLSPPPLRDSADSLQNKAFPEPPESGGVARRSSAVRHRSPLTLPSLGRSRESESLKKLHLSPPDLRSLHRVEDS